MTNLSANCVWWRKVVLGEREKERNGPTEGQRQRETDRDRRGQRQIKTGRDRQRQTDKHTKMITKFL